jgi:NitT/TauT family transport system substrate-binding protein
MRMLFIFFSLGVLSIPVALASTSKPLTLALNWKAEPQFGGFYAAEESFKAKNLKVVIQEGGSGTPTLQMLLAGKVEYAIVSADEIVISHDRGQKSVVGLFAVYQKNPQAIMVHQKNPAKNISELLKSDGRLLWQEGLPYAQFLIKKYGPLKIKTSPYTGGIGSFAADTKISQQCFATSEPLLAEKQGIKTKVFFIADSGYNPYTTVLATTRERLKTHPEEVKKIVQSIREGWQNYLKDPLPTHQKISTLNPAMNAQVLADGAKAQKELIQTPETKENGLGLMRLERWQTLVGQLADLHVIKSKLEGNDLFENYTP